MPGPYRYTSPPAPKSATGTAAAVYAQAATDFGIPKPSTLIVLSSAPELLAPAWALLRESLIAGSGSRGDRELVAAGVSQANRCPFCVDAHAVLLHAHGDHDLGEAVARDTTPGDERAARLLEWGRVTRVPGAPALTPPPFARADLPSHLGTAFAFHFINRIVSALLTENLLPAGAQRWPSVRALAGRSVARVVRAAHTPGTSLTLLDSPGRGPDWAAGTPVGAAYDALRTAATTGGRLLDDADLDLVLETVAAWDGTHPPTVWPALPDRADRPGARLALLAALAPYRITDEDVAAWRVPPYTDHCLVHLIAYGAFAAVDRIESALPASLSDLTSDRETR
ncbi:carboxymuconolactone decarboxylase family protein [Streptomyces sp. VRA16 Mangrove soil]|uniref:carboxymuconolactone decarboxylase family protein n=1 Tax=Streptomyces sp. VRA16 Mangrove soil TaxID=2817434 RepID=UPI001A9FD6E6|nr:carboxymuconolactone decarboxylase family protein [Streptomyces sp. VRA16 Mangrove soil]MBO1331175.1 carboxymuconolactone decarboxylase family protein [Streptomyces sp. VRA16 Mangrove soil]